jgi:hypothetical protein
MGPGESSKDVCVRDRARGRRLGDVVDWVGVADIGFAAGTQPANVDVLVLRTDGGPGDARLLFFSGIGLIVFGALFSLALARAPA